VTFTELWEELLPVGRDEETGGYLRYAWTEAELTCREWFAAQAAARDMATHTDGNGNLFAWWGDPAFHEACRNGTQPPSSAGDAVLTGSHFDSVPQGGAYDGPLGIVSAFLAIDELRARRVSPKRPIGVCAFVEEEGSRFGVACLGSRLLTGTITIERALQLRDRNGIGVAEAMRHAGADPAGLGPDPALLGRIGAFVELHVEQGRALSEMDAPVGVASAIWPHGRWRLDITGHANHAGTTAMGDRHDPMLTFAHTVLAANKEARQRGALATVGRAEVEPNATNAIPSRVTGWLDARAAEEETLRQLVEAVRVRAQERAVRDGTTVLMATESSSPHVQFDTALRYASAHLLHAPVLPTGAGHDAGVLASHVPTAMLFVRNPTGVSHAPEEQASDADCAAGVTALTNVLAELSCR
jgi:N-carbamoyl-L-amino-acid hydrolase